jgi:hypothetical protein
MSSQRKRGAAGISSRTVRIRRREILVLTGVWLAGCAIIAFLIGVFYANSSPQPPAQSAEPEATYQVQFSDETAKTAYLQALAAGRDWTDDVELVALSTRWNNATPDTLAQPEGWDVQFYSPRRERLYFVVITPDDNVLGRAHFRKNRQSPLLLDPTAWEIDSDEALSTWLNQGGGPFLEAYPENQVEILLRQTSAGPVWDVIGSSTDQSNMFYLPVNAITGATPE